VGGRSVYRLKRVRLHRKPRGSCGSPALKSQRSGGARTDQRRDKPLLKKRGLVEAAVPHFAADFSLVHFDRRDTRPHSGDCGFGSSGTAPRAKVLIETVRWNLTIRPQSGPLACVSLAAAAHAYHSPVAFVRQKPSRSSGDEETIAKLRGF
jgi:hypothetical protein